ncbi:hypothetical protein PIB30_058478 [Stylosanthes scabra]|uniref:Uncharacterized protein n=1 Tax=Stylosanthes scabra TaxID=79078 RepID=A0ABU6ZIP8_9FABA|nr:hypothetical protein [Stylosanthes scabra]
MLQSSTFKKPVWEDVNNDLISITGENYGVDRLMKSVSARTEVSKAKAEKYKSLASQATSSCTDPYSIEACMGLLNSLDNVSKTMYNKALAKFVQAEWRCIFMTMPTERRMDWLLDLD